jgi:glycosyltransferase involved in cell wall biosynthesis
MDPSLLGIISSFLGDEKVKTFGEEAEFSSRPHHPCDPHFHVVVFSKDRPWQLQQLVHSMSLKGVNDDLQVTVIVNVQDEYRSAYDKVVEEFTAEIAFLEEDEGHPFAYHLTTVIEGKSGNKDGLIWMFLTDDCLLLLPLKKILQSAWLAESDIFLSRLHPGISWCQTRGIPSPPPRNHIRHSPESKCFLYPLQSAGHDWAYPWDLSGGIYGNDLVQRLFRELDQESTSHPNKLELAGHSILRKKNLVIAMPSSPALLIVTINRVQHLYSAPVDQTVNARGLLEYLKREKKFDLNTYRKTLFNSSHVSDLVIAKDDGIEHDFFDLTVLLPVHTGPPEYAKQAIRSVVMQIQDQFLIHGLQVIIVDDRCQDGSVEAIQQAALDAAKDLNRDINVRDYRSDKVVSAQSSSDVVVEIYSSSKPGVAAALNVGLEHARSQFVARMDADDICAPGRFAQQLQYLQRNPHITAAGTLSVIISAVKGDSALDNNEVMVKELPFSNSLDDSMWKLKPSLPPTDPGFTAWAMLFSCCVSHPTAMFRKDLVRDAGGYNDELLCAEDYALWLELTGQNPRSVTSLPFVGLWHRKHRGNRQKLEKQKHEAHIAAFAAIKRYVSDVSEADVLCVRRPVEHGKCIENLDNGARLLLLLCENFVKIHKNALTTREIELIRHDCRERLAELASLSITRFGDSSSVVWKLWCELCPGRVLEQAALAIANSRT